MKFLCVLCDQPMKLVETAPPDRGSMSLVYECPECAHRIAMLTNPQETQVVGSLGVRIGPGAEGGADGESRCPFSGMVQEATAEAQTEADVPWTTEARHRLENIPEFVRPMAKTGIEKYAMDHGYREVTEKVLDEAREYFGM